MEDPSQCLCTRRRHFKEETDKMPANGIIVPVHQVTACINFFVVSQSTKADNTIKTRVCPDSRNLNKAIIRETYYNQTTDDYS